MLRIPAKERKEWEELVTGDLDVTLTNFFLRTKVNQIKEDTKKLKLTVDEAVTELVDICIELRKTRDISSDIEAIFGSVEEVIEKTKLQTFDLSMLKSSEIKKEIVEQASILDKISSDTFKEDNTREVLKEKLDKKDITEQNIEKVSQQILSSDTPLKIDEKKEVDIERERLKKASIERRNKERMDAIKREKGGSKGFFKSLFN